MLQTSCHPLVGLVLLIAGGVMPALPAPTANLVIETQNSTHAQLVATFSSQITGFTPPSDLALVGWTYVGPELDISSAGIQFLLLMQFTSSSYSSAQVDTAHLL